MHDANVTPIADPARLAAAAFLARYKGETRRGYQIDLEQFFAWCRRYQLDPLAATRPHLELWARHLEEERHLMPATVCRRLGTITGYYRYAYLDGTIPRSPAEYIRRPKIADESTRLGLDRMELGAVLATARASSPVDYALLVLMGLLGLRVSEACAVQIEDLGHERGHRTLTVTGKGGRVDTIPLPPPVFRAVDACAAARTEGPLLYSRAGTPLDRYAATRIVKRICKRAGIHKRVSPHSFRHSAVTAALDAGVPIRDVQLFARHADPKTTVRYDRHRRNLDRHASYVVAAFIAGAA